VAHYLVIHTPRDEEGDEALPPTRLAELAMSHGVPGSQPRWLKTWSPDLHDERVFSYWEAANAEEILTAIGKFGFLDNMDATAVGVHEWGPDDVLAAETAAEPE